MPVRLGDWLRGTIQILSSSSESPKLEAEVLCAHVMQKPRAWVAAHPETLIPSLYYEELDILSKKLQAGFPLPYLIGHWEFFGLDFIVTPDVLIPRPETELLVEIAIEYLENHPKSRWAVDLGTGSGCIAISLARKYPDLRVVAVDISSSAINIAMRNITAHTLQDRIALVHSNFLFPCFSPLSLICCNPPYIPGHIVTALPVARHEPLLSLDGGKDGTELIFPLIDQIHQLLCPGGLFLCEIASDQSEKIYDYASMRNKSSLIQILKDLQNKPRILSVELIQ